MLTLVSAREIIGQSAEMGDSLTRQLQSNDPITRANAFERLAKTSGALSRPGMRQILLSLLDKENRLVASTLRESNHKVGVGERYGEDWGVYRADLLEACFRLCPRDGILQLLLRDASSDLMEVRYDAINLLGTTTNRGFSPAQRDHIDAVLVVAAGDRGSGMVRTAAVGAMAGIAREDATMPAARRERFHLTATKATRDPDPNVRRGGVMLLGDIGSAADAPLLKAIAASDTTASVNRGHRTFPVRDAALAAISRLPPQ